MNEIGWWMAHYPVLVQVWAVLAILDVILLALIPFLPDEEDDEGYESASAFGKIDQLTEEVIRGP